MYLLLVGTSVYSVEADGVTRFLCACSNREDAEFVTRSIASSAGWEAKVSSMDSIPGVTLDLDALKI